MVRTRAGGGNAAAGVAVGSYTGDGNATQAIVGVGFQPRFVCVFQRVVAANRPDAWKTNVDGVRCMLVDVTSTIGLYDINHIISLDADGFTVGNGAGSAYGANALNVLGRVYTYACWR